MIHDQNFAIELGKQWERLSADAELHHRFKHMEGDLVALFHSRSFRAVHHDLDDMADIVAHLPFPDEEVTAEPIVVPRPWGRAIVRIGRDAAGTRHVFAAALTPTCLIVIQTFSAQRTEDELIVAADDLIQQLSFDRTPIEAYAAKG